MEKHQEDIKMCDENEKYKMVCIDGSNHSDRAMKWFFENIYKEGDDIGLIHVHTLPNLPVIGIHGSGTFAGDLYEREITASIQRSKEVADKYKAICVQKGVKFKVFIQTCQESVGHTISNIVNNHGSMVVIGQRGLGAIRRTLFGSVSDYVLHHVHVPVIVIPPSEIAPVM